MRRVRVGVSGWRYPEWRGSFYPKGLAQKSELAFMASQFDTVELNGSFYSLQAPASYRRWRQTVPADFVFAVKGSRFITHMKALRDVDTALANFFASGLLGLGSAFGPVLWQLPARAVFDAEKLENFLRLLPRSTDEAASLARHHDHRLKNRALLHAESSRRIRHAFEPRHESFRCKEATHLLEKYDIALVVSDGAKTFPLFDTITTDFTYVRLHGDKDLYMSRYTSRALDAWAAKIERWKTAGDVYVYFDNTAKVHAPSDALALRERLPRVSSRSVAISRAARAATLVRHI